MKYIIILSSMLCGITWCAEWKTPQDIGFEIRNHENYPITVTLVDYLNPRAYAFKDVYVSAKMGKNIPALKKALDIHNPYKLTIQYTTKNGEVTETFLLSSINKTLFVAWENGKLRPQKGSFGKTQSGLSLKRNLTQNDITRMGSELYGEL